MPKRKAPAAVAVAAASGGKKAKASAEGSDAWHLAALIEDERWRELLQPELDKPYCRKIETFVRDECAAGKEVFPPKALVFNALNLTPLDDVKVVILGQDPYHDNGQAHGLSFSVPMGVKPPPSLKNMYKELSSDVAGFTAPTHGCLVDWAERGVLLLNATLTVQAHKANSHEKIGWQTLTDAIIAALSNERDGVVFILWGGFAQKKEKLIDGAKHAVIKAAHPSPLSVRKFLGCKCFSKANAALEGFGKSAVDWQL